MGDVQFIYCVKIINAEEEKRNDIIVEFVTDVRLRDNELFLRGYDMDGYPCSNHFRLTPASQLEIFKDENHKDTKG